MISRRRSVAGNPGYDAFVSYSHRADTDIAAVLQAGVEKFAKRWHEIRALRLFRDKTSLALTPQLWPAIEHALARSEWFVLMASPEAASSGWVDQEVRWWLEHRSADRILIVLTGGELVWDKNSGNFDWPDSTAIPRSLDGIFRHEPFWVHARADPEDAVAGIAAAIRGVAKDQLVGVAIREHRLTMRLATGAIGALVTLLTVAIGAALVAGVQRAHAVEQATISLSRQVAATSQSVVSANLRVALLLAVQAYDINHNTQTLTALMQADTAIPKLVRYLAAGGTVTYLTGSSDGDTVVAGLADGRVIRWRLPGFTPRTVLTLPSAVSDLTVSRNGMEIAASDGATAELWQMGNPIVRLTVPGGEKADVVALSPSGGTLLVHGTIPASGGRQSIVVWDTAGERASAVHPDPFPSASSEQTGAFVLTSDQKVMILDSADGFWEWRRISDWILLAKNSPGLGPNGVTQLASVPSGNGRYITVTNGTGTITVRPTGRHMENGALDARTSAGSPTSLSLSYDGKMVAAAESGVIYVATTSHPGSSRAATIPLAGNGSINSNGLSFLGDDSHLISATGDEVAVWDLGQLDRLTRTVRTPVAISCSPCAGPNVAVSPDGTQAAFAVSSQSGATIQPLPGIAGRTRVIGRPFETYMENFPVWQDGGRHLILPFSPGDPAGSTTAGPAGLPAFVYSWPVGDAIAGVEADALASNGRSVIVVNGDGEVYLQDAQSGRVTWTIRRQPILANPPTNYQVASISSASNLVALVGRKSVRIVNPYQPGFTKEIREKNVTAVAFAGKSLLIQRDDGSLEVWDEKGTRRELTISGDTSYEWPPVPNRQGTRVARQRSDGTIVLDGLKTGSILDTFSEDSDFGARKTGIAFSPNGDNLITVTEPSAMGDGSLSVRALSGSSLVRAACAAAGSRLSAAEWRTFVGTVPPKTLACQ
jgi:WD40 repeat protein